MDMEEGDYIYILDYSDCSICEIHVTEEEANMEIEDVLEAHGCNINTSSCMTTSNEINNIIPI